MIVPGQRYGSDWLAVNIGVFGKENPIGSFHLVRKR
jgi:hypothetical protein